MNSFIWKNKDSYLEYGIVITQMPPESIPEENVDEITIPGRDGDLTIDYNTKKSYILPMACTLLDFAKIDEIKVWLSGSGDLLFNWQNYKYDARLNNKIDIAQSLENLGEFPLMWKVQPCKKSIDNNLITLTALGTVLNPGTYKSKPIVKIFGTGSIDLTINSTVIHLTNVVDYVTIDSELMDAYKDTTLKNNDMSGDFPELIPGVNNVSWTGNISRIEITPNWRWL